jgi:hypothetical protein
VGTTVRNGVSGGARSAPALLAVVLLVVSTVAVPAVAQADGDGRTNRDERAQVNEKVLVVADADTGEPILVVPVENGTRVTLAYTHSVEKTPVQDVYAVDGSELEMVEMRFQSYGAGLPARANVTRENEWFVFDPAGSYATVPVTPGEVAGHELRMGDRRYDLVALSGGESVELFVVRRCPS